MQLPSPLSSPIVDKQQLLNSINKRTRSLNTGQHLIYTKLAYLIENKQGGAVFLDSPSIATASCFHFAFKRQNRPLSLQAAYPSYRCYRMPIHSPRLNWPTTPS
eukprot:GHVS01041452.1.p2 GENE.GHVS01041452.1~~GHVS01041452.1.p2  ORF type:complete len:104 (+),score=10.00 GHVS01041452.1:607-918(+)